MKLKYRRNWEGEGETKIREKNESTDEMGKKGV